MLPHEFLQQISQHISELIPESVKTVKKDIDKNIYATLQTAFANMNLVSREEFDAQAKVLKRTREKVEALEEIIKKLEEEQKIV